jgi:Protein of unknown function (DUF2795)
VAFQVADVQKALKGVDYPVGPHDLAETAKRNGAGSDLVNALDGMHKDRFDGPNSVMKELKGQLTGSN